MSATIMSVYYLKTQRCKYCDPVFLPVLYVSEIWYLTLRDKHMLSVRKLGAEGKIFGTKKEEVTKDSIIAS
jgi:hypothetical protein